MINGSTTCLFLLLTILLCLVVPVVADARMRVVHTYGVIKAETFRIKGCSQGANHLVSTSPTYPKAYWAKPEPDWTWKTLEDLRINVLHLSCGQEGNVLHIQANENHPWGYKYDQDWAQNLDRLLEKADSYNIKIVFHSMGNKWGNLLGVVAPMNAYKYRTRYSSISNALVVIDKLGGNNELKKNFFKDPRVLWWCPINEAHIDDLTIRDWLLAVLKRIKSYGGTASVCVNDGKHRYSEAFPYILPVIGEYVDYLQAHCYNPKIIYQCTNGGPSVDMYPLSYQAFMEDCQSMIAGRGSFPKEKLFITECGCGQGTYKWHAGTDSTTVKQQADYIRGAFDACRDAGIGGLMYWDIIYMRPKTDSRYTQSFGFISWEGEISYEPYNAFKEGEL